MQKAPSAAAKGSELVADEGAVVAKEPEVPAEDAWTLDANGATPGAAVEAEYTENTKLREFARRRAGLLLHPTSCPGPDGCGDLGKGAHDMAKWMSEAGFAMWQVLPLVPPEEEGWSPYSSTDALCGNDLMISLDLLVREGLLSSAERPQPLPLAGRCDFDAVAERKRPLIARAARRLVGLEAPPEGAEGPSEMLLEAFEAFKADEMTASWLPDSALFAAACARNEGSWWEWPAELRDREPAALEALREDAAEDIAVFVATQFLFHDQWQALHKYANSLDISIVGDMPIYVGGHSSDVWASRELFALDQTTGEAAEVSGVPPDAFSATGQLWGSPLYDWEAHEAEGYAWWSRRLGVSLGLVDEMRIDHFRALAGYYAIDGKADTAMEGTWRMGPRMGFFEGIEKRLGAVRKYLIAEDLGVITPDVDKLRREIGAPGMVVLLFAWGGSWTNTHMPHNHQENSVCYPGTHDNDTVAGWYAEADEETLAQVDAYMGTAGMTPAQVADKFVRAAMASPARISIVQMQDLLGLENAAGRMNTPAVGTGNWGWRLTSQDIARLGDVSKTIRGVTDASGRSTPAKPKAAAKKKAAGAAAADAEVSAAADEP